MKKFDVIYTANESFVSLFANKKRKLNKANC